MCERMHDHPSTILLTVEESVASYQAWLSWLGCARLDAASGKTSWTDHATLFGPRSCSSEFGARKVHNMERARAQQLKFGLAQSWQHTCLKSGAAENHDFNPRCLQGDYQTGS
jgi:hypothetical protein